MLSAVMLDGQHLGIYTGFLYSIDLEMNSPPLPEVLRLREASPQEALPLATEGVKRYVWESRFGAMLIEVVDGVAYVNGGRVECVAAETSHQEPGVTSP